MSRNETTSMTVAQIAARALKHPELTTDEEIKKLAGSCLTQVADRKKKRKKKKLTSKD